MYLCFCYMHLFSCSKYLIMKHPMKQMKHLKTQMRIERIDTTVGGGFSFPWREGAVVSIHLIQTGDSGARSKWVPEGIHQINLISKTEGHKNTSFLCCHHSSSQERIYQQGSKQTDHKPAYSRACLSERPSIYSHDSECCPIRMDAFDATGEFQKALFLLSALFINMPSSPFFPNSFLIVFFNHYSQVGIFLSLKYFGFDFKKYRCSWIYK